MKFACKYKNIISWRCIWENRLPNWRPLYRDEDESLLFWIKRCPLSTYIFSIILFLTPAWPSPVVDYNDSVGTVIHERSISEWYRELQKADPVAETRRWYNQHLLPRGNIIRYQGFHRYTLLYVIKSIPVTNESCIYQIIQNGSDMF